MVTSCWSISDFLPVELGAGPHPLLFEEGPVRLEEAVERLVVGVALLVGEAGDLLGERARSGPTAGAGCGTGRRPAGEHDGDGAAAAPSAQPTMIPMTRVMPATITTGCDNYADWVRRRLDPPAAVGPRAVPVRAGPTAAGAGALARARRVVGGDRVVAEDAGGDAPGRAVALALEVGDRVVERRGGRSGGASAANVPTAPSAAWSPVRRGGSARGDHEPATE